MTIDLDELDLDPEIRGAVRQEMADNGTSASQVIKRMITEAFLHRRTDARKNVRLSLEQKVLFAGAFSVVGGMHTVPKLYNTSKRALDRLTKIPIRVEDFTNACEKADKTPEQVLDVAVALHTLAQPAKQQILAGDSNGMHLRTMIFGLEKTPEFAEAASVLKTNMKFGQWPSLVMRVAKAELYLEELAKFGPTQADWHLDRASLIA